MQKLIVKLENLSIAGLASYLYYQTADSIFLNFDRWYLIILAWLAVDLSMVGYLINKKIGAYIYNLFHNYLLALLVLITGIIYGNTDVLSIGLILFIHVGIDRSLGFGLKYPANFKDTHIQKL